VKLSNSLAEPKFRREAPEARREELITATLACLKKYGHDGVSVRRISAEAHVSMGLITHHFSGIDALVAAAYEALSTRLLTRSRELALARAGDPLHCLHAFFAASFAPEALDPGLFRTWLVFWSLVPHSREMQSVRERTNGETRATLETFLARLKVMARVPPFRTGPAARGLSALMDGLWVELSLNPTTFGATEAVALCDDWVHALANGAFPGLAASKRKRAATDE
jgi:AcrR family transcriptional regulator